MAVAQKSSTESTNILQPIFSRHETFPPRNGWLKKGFDAFNSDTAIFNREDAGIVMGVGKNMVKAIRYWCTAFKVGQEIADKATRTKVIESTEFGDALLGDNGWDPFLEDIGSLWLLHWNLLKQPCTATCWYFAFNHYRHPEFSQDDFLNDLMEYSKQTWADSSFSDATLKNDVSCFTRMYCKDESNRHVSEETISSPFSELNLLSRLSGGKHLAFHIGAKANLPSAIVVAAALEYAAAVRTTEKSVNISQLVYGIGSPGAIFKLPESSIYSALEEYAEKRKKDVVLSQTAGMVQLQFLRDPIQISQSILADYYAVNRR